MARGKAEVNAQVAASERAVVDARAAANVLVVVVDVRAAANVLAGVNVRVAASVLAVVSVKVAVREHHRRNRSLPIPRRSNSESNSREGEFEGRCLKRRLAAVTERELSALTAFNTSDALRETQPFGFFCFSA